MQPFLSISFSIGSDFVHFRDFIISESSTPPTTKVQFVRAKVRNWGFARADDCLAFATLEGVLDVDEALNWQHWPKDRDWMYGLPDVISKEEYLRRVQYEYLTNRKISLPRKISRLVDLVMIIQREAYFLGESQRQIPLPYEGTLRLKFSWRGAWRTPEKRVPLKIDEAGKLLLPPTPFHDA